MTQFILFVLFSLSLALLVAIVYRSSADLVGYMHGYYNQIKTYKMGSWPVPLVDAPLSDDPIADAIRIFLSTTSNGSKTHTVVFKSGGYTVLVYPEQRSRTSFLVRGEPTPLPSKFSGLQNMFMVSYGSGFYDLLADYANNQVPSYYKVVIVLLFPLCYSTLVGAQALAANTELYIAHNNNAIPLITGSVTQYFPPTHKNDFVNPAWMNTLV